MRRALESAAEGMEISWSGGREVGDVEAVVCVDAIPLVQLGG